MKFHFVILFSEAPMAVARRHPVGPELVDDVGGANFVPHWKKIKSETFGDFRDFIDRLVQFFHFIQKNHHLFNRMVGYFLKNRFKA